METQILDSEPIVEGAETPEAINVELLLKVADYVERNGERFKMNKWRQPQEKKLPNPWYRAMWGLPAPTEECGTVYCVAGWTVKLGGGDINGNFPAQAQRLLGLSIEQAKRLFYESNWPAQYRLGDSAPTDRGWVAAERIRHFAATAGAE